MSSKVYERFEAETSRKRNHSLVTEGPLDGGLRQPNNVQCMKFLLKYCEQVWFSEEGEAMECMQEMTSRMTRKRDPGHGFKLKERSCRLDVEKGFFT